MIVLPLTIAFIVICAVIDAEHLAKGQYFNDHRSRWIQRFVFVAAVGISNPYYSLCSALIFAALFDQVLNYLTEKPFWYLGTEAKWDKFWRKHLFCYKLIKVLLLVSGITIYYNEI